MFYRLSPAEALGLPGPEYLGLAYRASAYDGVLRLRAQNEQEDQAQEKKAVAPTKAAVEASPLAGLIDWG